MRRIDCAWLALAMSLTAACVAFAADNTVTGRIIQLQPVAGRLTLQTPEGRKLELSLDSRSEVKLHGQDARLSQFKETTRVRVTYESIDGKNRVISLRDAPVTAEEVQREMREALEAAKAYTFRQNEEYEKRLQPVLQDLDERIDVLKDKAKGAAKEARKRYAQAIEELRREREIVRQQLAKARAAAPGAWDEVKAGVGAAWDDLRKAFQRANDRLKEGNPSDQP